MAKRNGQSLDELKMRGDFIRRHIGPRQHDIEAMLKTLGLGSLEELIDKAVPAAIRSDEPLELAAPKSERMTISYLRRVANRNRVFISMMGMGFHGTTLPPVIQRNILENPAWYTAYTPYQAEISQGRLEMLINFQQMIMDLTGMELANASLLDEATAAAEAMAMAHRLSKSKSDTFFVDADCHPQTIAVVRTRARYLGLEVVEGDPFEDLKPEAVFGALFQYPGSTGEVRDFEKPIDALHKADALAVVAADILALAVLTPPGEMGADVVVGNTQRFGVPMGYGGPHAAYFATRDSFKRSVPGRIIGVSVDRHGNPALRMALHTREQHIRREKATSNICTAQVLLAVISAAYAVYHGPEGIRTIAERAHRMTQILAEGLRRLGFEVVNEVYYDTIAVRLRGQAHRIAAKARESRINLRVIDPDHLGITLDETTKRGDLAALWRVFATKASDRLDVDAIDEEVRRGKVQDCLGAGRRRTSEYLTHPVFSLYHSETEMERYLRRLSDMDIALDRSMIPLGSCTLKLNATTEMIPITWRQFSHMHPFAPLEQAQGYQQLFEELEEMLCEVTGFDAVSLQPNSGAQGEYSGLLCIRHYLDSRDEQHRTVCLIPASAHGTNPASARMAGLEVVTVESDEHGNIDVGDLEAKAKEHADRLAALMVTYPSTHGVFEEAIADICGVIHDHGGQVYMDGANLNALLGVAKPAHFGADVMHMNLHKTFCIPHGGGGPGVGPIGCKAHLAPFLSDHPVVEGVNPAAEGGETIGPVAAAPWGSASILPISWAYITMMGGEGLMRATQVAILNANYVAQRLSEHYPVLYTGKNGMVAHECIIDIRHIKHDSGVGVEDIAKRLIDYGIHAPTMSFPVPETLMVEPTESESRAEIDRFCEAMIAIREEIRKVEDGTWDAEDNPLTNAPHTLAEVTADDWARPYTRQLAAFPVPSLYRYKYWSPVGRVDNVYGDRHLVVTVPPPEDMQKTAAE